MFVDIRAATQLAQSVCLEVAANGGIGRYFLGAQSGNQVLVVQLDRPTRMLFVLQREVRSFEMEHTNALWHLDFHDGSRNVLTAQGRWVKPFCLCVIDDRSRLACHIQWYLDVTTKHLIHGFIQALMRRALPRAVMTDNGSAMISEEFTNGLHELGILHQPTLPRTPWANGKQERLWGTLEGRLMAMLEGEEEITLDLLNRTTHAWVEGDYHQNLDSEVGCSPLQRYRAGPDVGRECPPADRVRRAFQIESTRTQRRSDGTISLHGQRFEIPSQFAHLREVHVRYARWNLARLDLIDPRTGEGEHHIVSHPGRTPSPLRPGLGFRYAQPVGTVTGDASMNAMWTLLHTPIVQVPGFKGPSGMPVGLSLTSPRYTDRR